MAKQNRTTLKEYFQTGKSPSQNQYKDFIDSKVNMSENNVGHVLLTGNITASGDEGESHLGGISASNDVHVLNLIATGSSGTIQTTGDLTVGISGEPIANITSTGNITATQHITGLTVTAFGNVTANGDLVAEDNAIVKGTLDVDGDTTLDNTTIDGNLIVNGSVDLNLTSYDIDATDDIDIDTTDTTGGIAIGTANSGVPISIGHTTSETTVNDNLTVTGDLTVAGTTTTVNSTTVSIADPVFELGASGSDDNLDRGIKMKYNSSGAKFAFMGYDDSDGKFVMIPDASDSSSVFSGTVGTLKANIETGNTGVTVGSSVPFSDRSGTLTLQNVDAIEATTEATLEAAIDTLSNLTSIGTIGTGVWQGTAVAAGYGGTGLSSPGSSGQVLTSNGSGFVMQAIDGGTYS